jgi:hypothetical protein
MLGDSLGRDGGNLVRSAEKIKYERLSLGSITGWNE